MQLIDDMQINLCIPGASNPNPASDSLAKHIGNGINAGAFLHISAVTETATRLVIAGDIDGSQNRNSSANEALID